MIERDEQDIMKNWKGDRKTPIVSICTITYNHKNFIAEALDSFLMQETNFPFEIVIDEDCSPDGTAEVIKKYMEKFSHIIKANLREKNVGGHINAKENIQRSKGKYIALCEGDDYWTDPSKLQKQVDFLDNNKEYAISGHDAFIIDENGKHLKDSKLPDAQKKDFDGEELILGQTRILTLSWVCKKEAIKNEPDELKMVLNSDTFSISLIGHYGKSKYHDDIKPAAYRVHSGGVWSMKSKQEKLDANTNTYFWIYRYYNRIGEEKYAKYFLERYQERVISKVNNKIIINELKNRFFAYIPEPIKKILRPIKHSLSKI